MKWRPFLTVAAIVVPILALFAFGMTIDQRTVPSPLAGGQAPDFKLLPLDAEMAESQTGAEELDGAPDPDDSVRIRLSDHAGEGVVVNFWASWCLPCREEHVPLSRVAEAYRERGVAFYGILYNDSPSNARRWLEEMGGQSYPTLLDPGSRTAIDYGLYGVPETFFIGRDGRVAYKHFGPVTERLLIDQLERLLADGPEEAAP